MTTDATQIEDWELEWTFGDRLRKARRVVGLSTEELSQRLGVAKQAVNNWEIGNSNCSTPELIARKMQTLFGVPAWWLMGRERPNDGPDGGGEPLPLDFTRRVGGASGPRYSKQCGTLSTLLKAA